MTNHVLRVLVLFLGLNGYVAEIPEGYVLRILPSCGADSTEDAGVDIITDLRAEATAICASQEEINFNNTDGVNLHLDVSYPDRGNGPCVFQRKDTQMYVIEIHVAWGEPDNPIHTNEQEFYVTCIFDKTGNRLSNTQHVEQSLVAPVEIRKHLGGKSTSNFTLTLKDIMGNALTSSVPLGRLVYLHAHSDGDDGEKGIRPAACDAVSISSGNRYAVLRAGCGDGVVFNRKHGFITSNLTTSSPYFRTFVMDGDSGIQFSCNFTLCNQTCEGSSCHNDIRDIRSPDMQPHSLDISEVESIVRSDVIDVLADNNSTKDPAEDESVVKDNAPDGHSELYLADVFWVGILCIGIAVLLSVCLFVCVNCRVVKTRREAVVV